MSFQQCSYFFCLSGNGFDVLFVFNCLRAGTLIMYISPISRILSAKMCSDELGFFR